MFEEIYHKNEQFRMNIRQKHIENLFQLERKKFLQQSQRYRQLMVTQSLTSQEQKNQWIENVSKKLTGYPNPQWVGVLNDLHSSVNLYRYEHKRWLELGIIFALVELFQHSNRQLTRLSAQILTDIFYLNETSNPGVIRQIMKYDFVDNLIFLFQQNHDISYLRLLSYLVDSFDRRDSIIGKGLLDVIQDLLGRVQKLETQQNFIALKLVKNIVTTHKIDESTIFHPKKQFVMRLFPCLSLHIFYDYSPKYLYFILKSIEEIANLKKQAIFQMIFLEQNFVKQIMSFLYKSSASLRIGAARIMTMLLFSREAHIDKLLEMNLLSAILQVYKNEKSQSVIVSFIEILSNLTADEQKYKEIVANHQILTQILIPSIQFSYSEKIKNEALYCICNLMRTENPQILHRLVYECDLIDILMTELKEITRNTPVFDDMLETLETVVERSSKLGKIGIKKLLMEKYNLEDILINIDEELPERVRIFLDRLNQYE